MSITRVTAFKSQARRLGLRHHSSLPSSFPKTEFSAEREAVKHHAVDSAGTWKKISIFVCIPALAASGFNAYNLYSNHLEHQKHHPHEWIKYPYINFRARDYFWGKNSLFFNPEVNLSAIEE